MGCRNRSRCSVAHDVREGVSVIASARLRLLALTYRLEGAAFGSPRRQPWEGCSTHPVPSPVSRGRFQKPTFGSNASDVGADVSRVLIAAQADAAERPALMSELSDD